MDDRSPHMPFLMEMAGSDLFDALYDDNQLGATAADMIRRDAVLGVGNAVNALNVFVIFIYFECPGCLEHLRYHASGSRYY